eukprot:TRINITY_DN918_c0_g1_i1.p1 TRINITY_DN918_c0_g1~~TRINITY_DN918_c0_g1_i1.p1  ORF type:complete len:277 (-),score=47.29 TRINITY_DN918_c0_g1_i1:377-1207(-)
MPMAQLLALALAGMSAMAELEAHQQEQHLTRFYAEHSPDKLGQLPHLLRKYNGSYDVMWRHLRRKYLLPSKSAHTLALHAAEHHQGLRRIPANSSLRLYRHPQFANSSEVEMLIEYADQSPELARSVCRGAECHVSHTHRTSSSVVIASNGRCYPEVPPVVAGVLERISELLDSPLEEMAQDTVLVRYRAGERYQFHYDTDRETPTRFGTFLLYLSSHQDGETIFPLIPGRNTQNTSLPPGVDVLNKRKQPMEPYCETDQYLKIRPVFSQIQRGSS